MAPTAPEGAILQQNQGPWGNRGGSGNGDGGGPSGGNGGGNDPWKPRPSGGRGGNDPDLDDMLRQAQHKFRSTFGGKRPGGDIAPGKAILALIGLLAVLWLATGFYTVQPDEDAVILTFGKVTGTQAEAGLGYTLPYPIQEAIKVNVEEIRKVDVGFERGAGAAADNPQESAMLTGDENIVNIHFTVFWRVVDAGKYMFSIYDPDSTVGKVAESAMREIIGRTPIQRALTEGRAEIESGTRELMQKMLDDYSSGVAVNSVQLLSVDPPPPVVDAFNDVQRARTDRERLRNEAETYRNDIVPRARGQAQKTVQDAGAYKEAVISKATGDADRFLSVYEAYATSKDVTQKRIYIETMQEVLQNSRKIIMGDPNGSGVLPWLQVDPKSASTRIPPQPQAE
jgi:modulator of FtsH protease HflK